jgi:hypothetical protein
MDMFKAFTTQIIFAIALPSFLWAQSAEIPLNYAEYHVVDRLEIKSGQLFQTVHSSNKPFRAGDVLFESKHYSTDTHSHKVPVQQLMDMYYLNLGHDEFNEGGPIASSLPILNTFYKNKADLFKYVSKDFMIRINPIFNFQLGNEKNVQPSNGKKFTNTRGIDVAGWIGRKLGFYANITENQFRPPISYENWVNTTAPGSSSLSFSNNTQLAVGNTPISVAVGDLNGDGKPDLAVANKYSNTVSILLNTMAPGASTPTLLPGLASLLCAWTLPWAAAWLWTCCSPPLPWAFSAACWPLGARRRRCGTESA